MFSSPPQFSMSFPPEAVIAKSARVKLLSTGKIEVCGLADEGIGFAIRDAFQKDVDNATPIGVRLDGPVAEGIAAEAFAAGVRLHSAAAGKVADTAAATSFPRGISLEAATADGDLILYMISTGAEAT